MEDRPDLMAGSSGPVPRMNQPRAPSTAPAYLASKRLLGLYLRLSMWIIPGFLLFALAGLIYLMPLTLLQAERDIEARMVSFVQKAALTLQETARQEPALAARVAGPILSTIVADHGIDCAELRSATGEIWISAPTQSGCAPPPDGQAVSVPFDYTTPAILYVTWNQTEFARAEARKQRQFIIALAVGLLSALLASWLAFRKIIGAPLRDLVHKVDSARQEAEHNAVHDSLTGLANRRLLDMELARRSRSRQRMTILQIDLDGFKSVNDTLGHSAGDTLLVEVAERLKTLARPGELIARNGGDEFVILMAPDVDLLPAKKRADSIIEVIGKDFDIRGELCRVGASVGIASGAPKGNVDLAGRILANADIALYQAKANGRGEYAVYSSKMRSEMEKRRNLADEIQRALERREFVAHYQPQTATDCQTLVGLEALARWQHPRDGLLAPGAFIEAAEEMGMVDHIDKMILDCALEDIRYWHSLGLSPPRVSVNVSARRLYSARLIEELRAMDLPQGVISFEVLETVLIDGSNTTLSWNLDGLRELGIDVEVDDFGTGRASITSILALKPARLKVAREIIHASDAVEPRTELLAATIALGRAVGVELVAEGVENNRQIGMVRDLGFDILQGYAIAKPMPREEIEDWIMPDTNRPHAYPRKNPIPRR